jgi:hypothetical protein
MGTWPVFYFLLFAYRVTASLTMQPVVLAFTTLGDSSRYGHATRSAFKIQAFWTSTVMNDTIGEILQRITFGNTLLVAVGFQCIAFVGLLKLLMTVEPMMRRKLIILMMFPSFTIWSSVPSKEAVVVFAMGLALSYLVELFRGQERLSLLHLVGFYFLLIYKSQYFIAILFIILTTKLAAHVRQKAFLPVLFGLLSLLPLYLFRDRIDALSFEVQRHFVGFGRSTREEFFVTQYDVFEKMFTGIFQSFYGPTWSEAQLSLLHMMSFVESGLIVIILIFYIIRQLPRTPAYSFFLSLFALFWILFPTYPLGIMNPGTAIRYRTGYILLIFVIMIVCLSRSVYETWNGTSQRSQLAARSQRPGNA